MTICTSVYIFFAVEICISVYEYCSIPNFSYLSGFHGASLSHPQSLIKWSNLYSQNKIVKLPGSTKTKTHNHW